MNDRPIRIPKKHMPRGFEILHEDQDLIVGNKAAGFLTVSALWNKTDTIHSALNWYVRKGNPKSRKCAYVVHRLDQATTGVLVFAKSEEAQNFLKDNWKDNEKIYFVVVHGKLKEKSGMITSHLVEDDEYVVRSTKDPSKGKLAQTEYEVLKETDRYSLLRVRLLTGRKNQIRVHMAEHGNPVVGDSKYTPSSGKASGQSPVKSAGKAKAHVTSLALHSHSLTLTHPFNKKRMTFTAPVPALFRQLVPFDY